MPSPDSKGPKEKYAAWKAPKAGPDQSANLSPMWQNKAETASGYLNTNLEKISSGDIAKARMQLAKELEGMKDGPEKSKLDNRYKLLQVLGSLKVAEVKNRPAMLEKIAKGDYSFVVPTDESGHSDVGGGAVADAVFQLMEACKAVRELQLIQEVRKP